MRKKSEKETEVSYVMKRCSICALVYVAVIIVVSAGLALSLLGTKSY